MEIVPEKDNEIVYSSFKLCNFFLLCHESSLQGLKRRKDSVKLTTNYFWKSRNFDEGARLCKHVQVQRRHIFFFIYIAILYKV